MSVDLEYPDPVEREVIDSVRRAIEAHDGKSLIRYEVSHIFHRQRFKAAVEYLGRTCTIKDADRMGNPRTPETKPEDFAVALTIDGTDWAKQEAETCQSI